MVVMECMKNIHPVYNIKRLMIMKELEKDPKLKDESWERFLPTFKKKNVQRRKPRQLVEERQKMAAAASTGVASAGEESKSTGTRKKKKSYTPFPPAQQPSKIDLQLDSGEYFLSERERKAKKLLEKQAMSKEKSEEKQRSRDREFLHPSLLEEDNEEGVNSESAGGDKAGGSKTDSVNATQDVDRLVNKFAKSQKKRKSAERNTENEDAFLGLDKHTKKGRKRKKKKSLEAE